MIILFGLLSTIIFFSLLKLMLSLILLTHFHLVVLMFILVWNK